MIMKALLRCISKGFFTILGLSLGVVLAVVTLCGMVGALLNIGASPLVSFPDAQGEIQSLGKTAPIIFNLEIKDMIASTRQTSRLVQQALLQLEEAPFKGRVQGILIDMDCPGGEVNEIVRVYDILNEWKQRTGLPIYVFVSGCCASGGYYISCVADRIYATPSALIGSVGVLAGPLFNVKEGLKRYGVEAEILTAGKDKAPMNPFSTWTAKEREYRQSLLDAVYDQFVDLVVASRPKVTKERLVNVLGARVFFPKVALQEGLIDVADSSRQEALEALVKERKLATYRVVGCNQDGFLRKVKMCVENSPLLTGQVRIGLAQEGDVVRFSY